MEKELGIIKDYINNDITDRIQSLLFIGDEIEKIIQTHYPTEKITETKYRKSIADFNYKILKCITDFFCIDDYIIPENLFIINKSDIIIENATNGFVEFMINNDLDLDLLKKLKFAYAYIPNANVYIEMSDIDRSEEFDMLLGIIKGVLNLTIYFQNTQLKKVDYTKYISKLKYRYFNELIIENLSLEDSDDKLELSDINKCTLNIIDVKHEKNFEIKKVNELTIFFKTKKKISRFDFGMLLYDVTNLHVKSESIGLNFSGTFDINVDTLIIENMSIDYRYSDTKIRTKNTIIKNSFVYLPNEYINSLFDKCYIIWDSDVIDLISKKMEGMKLLDVLQEIKTVNNGKPQLIKHALLDHIDNNINDIDGSFRLKHIIYETIMSKTGYYNNNNPYDYTSEVFKQKLKLKHVYNNIEYYIDNIYVSSTEMVDDLISLLQKKGKLNRINTFQLYAIGTNNNVRKIYGLPKENELADNIENINNQIEDITSEIQIIDKFINNFNKK